MTVGQSERREKLGNNQARGEPVSGESPMTGSPMGQSETSKGGPMDPSPPFLAVDANGYVWRVYNGHWSMAPSNPDNEPVPGPITYYAPIGQRPTADDASTIAAAHEHAKDYASHFSGSREADDGRE